METFNLINLLWSSKFLYYNGFMKRGRPPGRKLSHSVTLRVDDDVMEALLRLADEERRPLAMMSRLLLEDALQAREGKRRGSSEDRREE